MRLADRQLAWFCGLAGLAVLAATASSSEAQSPDQLPAAPKPQVLLAQTNLAMTGAPVHDEAAGGDAAAAGGHPAGDAEASPVVAMLPHPEESRYWISGQANIIFQGHLPFHSPLSGNQQLHQLRGAYKTSLVGTLYRAIRPTHSIRYNTDLILDLESAGGRGLERGAWDWPDSPTSMWCAIRILARRHTSLAMRFTRWSASHRRPRPRSRGPLRLAPSVPLRRVEFRIGKMTLPDFFDVNGSRLRLASAVHELDRGQQRRVGLRRRHPRIHRWRHGRVRRSRVGASAMASSPCPRSPMASIWTGPSAGRRDRTASSSCGTAL